MGLFDRISRLVRSNISATKTDKPGNAKPAANVSETNKPESNAVSTQADEMAEEFRLIAKQARYNHDQRNSLWKLSASPAYERLKKQDAEYKAQFLIFVSQKLKSTLEAPRRDFNQADFERLLFGQLIKLKFDMSEEHLVKVVLLISNTDTSSYWLPYRPLITRVKKHIEAVGLSPLLKAALEEIEFHNDRVVSSAADYENERMVKELINGQSLLVIKQVDAFGSALNVVVQTREGEETTHWTQLVELCKQAKTGARPKAGWLKKANALLMKMDQQFLSEAFVELFKVAENRIKEVHKTVPASDRIWFLHDENVTILRGMIWLSQLIEDHNLYQAIEALGLMSFKKLPGVGAVSAKTGNACLYTLSRLPEGKGIAQLSSFKQKIKLPSVHTAIDKLIEKVALEQGKTIDEVEEIAVPDYGLVNHEYREDLGDFTAILRVTSYEKVVLVWEKSGGKEQKSVPAVLKETAASEIKALKAKQKAIQLSLSAQKNRVEAGYLKKRVWTLADWHTYYHNHGLMSFLTRHLIWQFSTGDTVVNALYLEGQFVNEKGETVDIGISEEVRLWHPVHAEEGQIQAWRDLLMDREIRQPFKQAFREVYVVTAAEEETDTYSNRFAAHILRQHQFAALCKQRDWRYSLMGGWDSHNIPYKELTAWGLRAEYWVEGSWDIDGSMNDLGIFNIISSDQVRFYENNEQLRMVDVPPIVFSEIMRDVDLFVGVTSIGNDPTWTQERGQLHTNYWNNFSFGELGTTAQTRKGILERLVPRLKIAAQCSFDGNFLLVKGSIRTYKIHMGSSNILMTPNDQYLCIVPDRSGKTDKLFLPFDGDITLSLILSKAFLLAEDQKITDPQIVSQIRR